jgi:hypothetical protein
MSGELLQISEIVLEAIIAIAFFAGAMVGAIAWRS